MLSPQEEAQIKKRIESYKKTLKRHPEDNNTLSLVAAEFVVLYDKSNVKDVSHLDNALEYYNKAINITPLKQYYADRSKVHAKMGNTDKAAEDILEAKKMPEGDILYDSYVNDTARELLKLKDVQGSLQKLKSEGKIDGELAEALDQLASTTKFLVLKSAAHDEKLDQHDDKIEWLNKTVAYLLSRDSISEEEQDNIKKQIKAMDIRLTSAEQDIVQLKQSLEVNIDKLKSIINQNKNQGEKKIGKITEKLNVISKHLESANDSKLLSEITQKVIGLIQRADRADVALSDIESDIDEINKTLESHAAQIELNEGQIKDLHEEVDVLFEAEKNKSLEILSLQEFQSKFPEKHMKFQQKEKEYELRLHEKPDVQRKLVKDYIEGFKAQCSVAYTSALVIRGGQLKLDTSNIYATIGSKLVSFIPYVGDIASKSIDFIADQVKSIDTKAKADNLIKYSSSITEFEQNMLYAIQSSILNDNKQNEILNQAEQKSDHWWQSVMSFSKKIAQKAKNIIREDMLEQNSTPQYKLGMKDANDILAKLLLSGQVLKETQSNTDTDLLDVIIRAIVKNNEPTNNNSQMVHYFTVEYDNPAIEMLSTEEGKEIFKASNKSLNDFITIGAGYANIEDFALDMLGD